MKLSLGSGPKFAEKRDEPPLWAPDYYEEMIPRSPESNSLMAAANVAECIAFKLRATNS
jgi:hypothetical protein